MAIGACRSPTPASHVELAYATAVYGAQGETTHAAHLVLGEHTGAASAYRHCARRPAWRRPVQDRLSDQTYTYGEIQIGPGSIGRKNFGRVATHRQCEATPIAERKSRASAQ